MSPACARARTGDRAILFRPPDVAGVPGEREPLRDYVALLVLATERRRRCSYRTEMTGNATAAISRPLGPPLWSPRQPGDHLVARHGLCSVTARTATILPVGGRRCRSPGAVCRSGYEVFLLGDAGAIRDSAEFTVFAQIAVSQIHLTMTWCGSSCARLRGGLTAGRRRSAIDGLNVADQSAQRKGHRTPQPPRLPHRSARTW